MPKFVVQQYELHFQTYEVEAVSAADAIAQVLDGKAEADDNGSEFTEVAENYGAPFKMLPELVEPLRALGIVCRQDFLPTIRDVYQLRDEEQA